MEATQQVQVQTSTLSLRDHWQWLQSRLPPQQKLDEHAKPEYLDMSFSLTKIIQDHVVRHVDSHTYCAYLPHHLTCHLICGSDMEYVEEPLLSGLLTRCPPDHARGIYPEVGGASDTEYHKPLLSLDFSLTGHRIFYWFGEQYDTPLLIQACIMVFVQVLLLHVALLNRPPVGAQHSLNKPFAGHLDSGSSDSFTTRPYSFWQWRSRKPYWQFLLYYSIALLALQIIIGTSSSAYVALQGYVALSVEAILPIPQILENQRIRSCKGFRLSVLVNWLVGDTFKMTYFFLSGNSVPWAFKLCGLFQAACDCYLGVQYWMYGEGEVSGAVEEKEKDARLA